MTKLHELLAVEKTVLGAWQHVHKETADKLRKDQFFSGHVTTLKMLEASDENDAKEKAAREERQLPTTVEETLDFYLQLFAKAEDLLVQKNRTNTKAIASVVLDGQTFLTDLPVDELMGLEARLERFRNEIALAVPTLDAGKAWHAEAGDRKGARRSTPENTSKTEKIMFPVIMVEATDKHPAQVKESTRDKVVGTFTKTFHSGNATTLQKSVLIERTEKLIAAIKQARQRANSVEVGDKSTIGETVTKYLMGAFEE